VAARSLATRRHRGTKVILVESTDRLGGKILTHLYKGAAIDAGPDWFLTANETMPSLCRELGLEDKLVSPSASGAFIWTGDGMQPMPKGFVRGVPASGRALLRCRNLSVTGKTRALADLVLPGPLRGPDVSVAHLVQKRFGTELLARLVDPILAASRSGSADEMSLAAGAPEIDEAARSRRSVMTALGRRQAGGGPSFRGLEGGMSTLVAALSRNLEGVEVRLQNRLVSLAPTNNCYELRFENGALNADAVVLALPTPVGGRVLQALDDELAGELATIRYTSGAVVSLVYPPGAVEPPPGASGFLVPSDEGRLITAAAWYSAKWAGARPDDGSFVVRCFAGRGSDDYVLRLTDADLIHRISHEVALAMKILKPHRAAFVDRWRDALPLYEVGHHDRVERIEDRAARHPRLALAGAGYRGSGLPDCVTSGAAAAQRIMNDIG
jgi:protoporphyrinogen/coproporphyrinogen III oxidase